MLAGFRLSQKISSAHHAASRLLTAHPDWDLQALNDEMEGLIGKFDNTAENNDPSGVDPTVSSLPPPLSSINHANKVEAVGKDNLFNAATRHGDSITAAPKASQLRAKSNTNAENIPSFTILHFDQDIKERYYFEHANVYYKSWQDFSTLDVLMDELADDSTNGIIFLQHCNHHDDPLNVMTPAQQKLLKIYKKSSPVVLVIGNSSVSSPADDNHRNELNDISFASCIIQGLMPKDGIAAAIAGIISSRNTNIV
jgi:hypothetical protein